MQPFPTYLIMTTPLQGVQLRPGKVLQQKNPTITIKEEVEKEENYINSPNGILQDEEYIHIPQTQDRSQPKKPQMAKHPPYSERLAIEKPIVQLEFNIESQLRNIFVNIYLLQAIRDVPIYGKIVRNFS